MQLASLNFYDSDKKTVLFSKKPNFVQKDKSRNSWTFVFNIKEEQRNKDYAGLVRFAIDLTQIVNEKNKAFALNQGLRLPYFKLESIYEKPAQQKQAEEARSTIQQEIQKNITSTNEAGKLKGIKGRQKV